MPLYFARESGYVDIRKDFINFHVYRTFENASHLFWLDYEYYLVVDFFKSYNHSYLYKCFDSLFELVLCVDAEECRFDEDDLSFDFNDTFFF